MATMKDWVDSTPERARLFAEERLIALAAEEIWEAMNRRNMRLYPFRELAAQTYLEKPR